MLYLWLGPTLKGGNELGRGTGLAIGLEIGLPNGGPPCWS